MTSFLKYSCCPLVLLFGYVIAPAQDATPLPLQAFSTAQAQEPIQPVFRFPLEQGYPLWGQCVQGENGATSHYFPEDLYDHDFDTPNPGQATDPLQVVAAADGIAYKFDYGCVRGASCYYAYGNHVKISHGSNVFSLYGHLERILITNGQRVLAGEPIGIEGSAGASEGDHVHFGVHVGDAQASLVGKSVRLEYMAVIDSTVNSGVQLLQGAGFVCSLPGGHYYTAATVPVCHKLASGQPVPANYGAAYDVFSPADVLLKANCTPTDTRITVGNNQPLTYVYHIAQQWINDHWEAVTLQCLSAVDTYCVGEGIGKISSQSPYFLAYTCRWTGKEWKCGCRDQQCTNSFWQAQSVQ